MIQRLVEAILRPALNLAGVLMASLILAPLRALLGPREEGRVEERPPEPDVIDADEQPALEDRTSEDGPV